MSFLLLHGWQNRRPPEHWQHSLAEALRADGEEVAYPQLPDPDAPRLSEWLAAARGELGRPGRVVVCHSLGCLLWAFLAPRLTAGERADRVLWVAPPGPSFLASQAALAEFRADGLDAGALRASSAQEPLRLVCSEDDPYCPEGADAVYGRPLGLDVDLLAGQAHLNPDAGYGEWPSVLEWCRDPRVRITARG